MIRTSDTDGTTWSSDLMRQQAWRESLTAAGDARRTRSDRDVRRRRRRPRDGAAPCATGTADRGLRLLRRVGVRGHRLRPGPRGRRTWRPVGHRHRRTPARWAPRPHDHRPVDLTTIDQDVAGQGRLAAELAVRLLRGVDEVANVRVEAQLVDRGSTASLA